MPTVVSGSLPFTVDSKFIPTGYIGDYSNIMQTGDTSGTICGGRAVTGAAGTCYKVVYTFPAPANKGYAGVEWQANPAAIGQLNFGTAPGIVPPPGATEASFYAKGAVGGEVVTFFVGSGGTAPCTDSVITPSAGAAVMLTTTWTRYTLPFSGQAYAAGQIVGFAWSSPATAGADAGAMTTFYIDDILWDAATDM
jgi:hypothetical protein